MPVAVDRRPALKSAGFVLFVTLNVSVWPASSAGPRSSPSPNRHRLRPGLLGHRRVGARESGRVVDRRDRDREALRRRRVHAAAGRAAVVLQLR